MEKQYCDNCGKDCIKHAKGMCITCYKKLAWKPKPRECKRCKRMLPHHAKGMCGGCYNTVFNLQKAKDFNYKKWHNILPEVYKRITEKCIACGYTDIVELHHLDGDKTNNSEDNLVGLCPNDHKKIHRYKFRSEVITKINEVFKSQGLPLFTDTKIFIQNNPRK